MINYHFFPRESIYSLLSQLNFLLYSIEIDTIVLINLISNQNVCSSFSA